MIFAPARLGSVTLDNGTLAADKKGCRRFGPCGVGEKALYLNSFFIDRHYYVALSSVRRVFKRVAMSKGGFTGKGAFGSIPYLVVEYDGGEKQCNFKHEMWTTCWPASPSSARTCRCKAARWSSTWPSSGPRTPAAISRS